MHMMTRKMLIVIDDLINGEFIEYKLFTQINHKVDAK